MNLFYLPFIVQELNESLLEEEEISRQRFWDYILERNEAEWAFYALLHVAIDRESTVPVGCLTFALTPKSLPSSKYIELSQYIVAPAPDGLTLSLSSLCSFLSRLIFSCFCLPVLVGHPAPWSSVAIWLHTSFLFVLFDSILAIISGSAQMAISCFVSSSLYNSVLTVAIDLEVEVVARWDIRDVAFFVFEWTKHQPRRHLRSYLVVQRLCSKAALSPGINAFLY